MKVLDLVVSLLQWFRGRGDAEREAAAKAQFDKERAEIAAQTARAEQRVDDEVEHVDEKADPGVVADALRRRLRRS
jgi:hypothetical protein